MVNQVIKKGRIQHLSSALWAHGVYGKAANPSDLYRMGKISAGRKWLVSGGCVLELMFGADPEALTFSA